MSSTRDESLQQIYDRGDTIRRRRRATFTSVAVLVVTVALVPAIVRRGEDHHVRVTSSSSQSPSTDTTVTQPEVPCEPNMPVTGSTDASPGSVSPAVEQTFVDCVHTMWDVRGPRTVTYVQTTDGQARSYADPASPYAKVPVFVLFLKGPFNSLYSGGGGRGPGPPPGPTSVYGVIATDGHPILVAGWASTEDYDLSKLGAPQSTVIDFG